MVQNDLIYSLLYLIYHYTLFRGLACPEKLLFWILIHTTLPLLIDMNTLNTWHIYSTIITVKMLNSVTKTSFTGRSTYNNLSHIESHQEVIVRFFMTLTTFKRHQRNRFLKWIGKRAEKLLGDLQMLRQQRFYITGRNLCVKIKGTSLWCWP